MNVYEKRQHQKALNAHYRAIARKQYLTPEDGCTVAVTEHACVNVMEDGAFVEAIIWIPKVVSQKE